MAILNRDDVSLHYEISGCGSPVLLIQGVGVTGEGWRLQVDGLNREFQTLTFDNRGIGRSQPCRGAISIEAMADDARALMDAAGWESAHVAGHSMGGVIAPQLALDHPGRVRSLALLCTFARGGQAVRISPRILWSGLRTRIGPRAMKRQAFLEMVFPAAMLRRVDRVELAEHCGRLFGRDLADSPPILLRQLRALGRHDGTARLGELARIPALVISAEQDPIALPRFGRELARRLGRASYEEMPASSHAVIIQEAGLINRRLARFWREVGQGGVA